MDSRLFARETGDLPPRAFAGAVAADLIRRFGRAPHHRFDGETKPETPVGQAKAGGSSSEAPAVTERAESMWAHRVGVSALAVEKFDGRILVSGGADGAVRLWDLDQAANPNSAFTFRPIGRVTRSSELAALKGHSHGITSLGFYPFDPDAFLSTSFDKSLKVWSTQKLAISANFDLNATTYSHATSPIADHLLVACATKHSNVRLVDLRSSSPVQALVAHGGPVLSVAWSPRNQHILASGHVDGRVRIWDVRRAGGVIAHLDQEDGLGLLHRFHHATASGADWSKMPHFRASARAHTDAVNGLTWTDDGMYIVSAGHDRRIRVWDAATGANTLVSFGSVIQNRMPHTITMLTSPAGFAGRSDMLFWPNEAELLGLDLHAGTVVTRLRAPGIGTMAAIQSPAGMGRTNRITSLAWRGASGDGRQAGRIMGGATSYGAIYSGHLDGHIRAWVPRLEGADQDDFDDDSTNDDEEAKKRKRKAIDDAYRSMTGRQITFT